MNKDENSFLPLRGDDTLRPCALVVVEGREFFRKLKVTMLQQLSIDVVETRRFPILQRLDSAQYLYCARRFLIIDIKAREPH